MLSGLLKFWPMLIPFILYFGWLSWARAKAKKEGQPITRFTDGPWVLTLIASLIVGACCFVFWGLSFEPTQGEYRPPHMQDGKLIEGQIEPKP